ncbi:LacI family transcriptional regulator [Rhodobacteraceae bacterium]|nr:LacI family transcriptional regulator [Paracoccaceae bacterium]
MDTYVSHHRVTDLTSIGGCKQHVPEGGFRVVAGVHPRPRWGAMLLAGTARAPPAIFAGNDLTALGVINGLMRHRIKIPEDVLVAGGGMICPQRDQARGPELGSARIDGRIHGGKPKLPSRCGYRF